MNRIDGTTAHFPQASAASTAHARNGACAEVACKRGCPVELPVGGTTGLDHQSSAAIDEAAAWLAAEATLPNEIVPALRGRFGLSFEEASLAIGDAQRRRPDVRQ